jgi:hypothetical protein
VHLLSFLLLDKDGTEWCTQKVIEPVKKSFGEDYKSFAPTPPPEPLIETMVRWDCTGERKLVRWDCTGERKWSDGTAQVRGNFS